MMLKKYKNLYDRLQLFDKIGAYVTVESNLKGYSDFYKETGESKICQYNRLNAEILLKAIVIVFGF